MTGKHHVYTGAQFGWVLLVIGSFVALYAGLAEPIVTPARLPGSPYVHGTVAVAAAVAGWLGVAYWKGRSWREMGRRAGLAPPSGSSPLAPFTRPALTGTVDGRSVRVRITSRERDATEGGGASTVTSTLVEAELTGSADEGVVVGRSGSDRPTPDTTDVGGLPVGTAAVDDRFVAVGGNESLAGEILTARVRERLRAVDTVDALLVGNALEAVTGAVDGLERDTVAGSIAAGTVNGALDDDPATVASRIDGAGLDPDELRRQLEAVVAIAEAFEEATAGTPLVEDGAKNGAPA